MTATTEYLAVAAMFGGMIAGRLLAEAGLRALTTEQKGMLVELFADLRRYHLLAFVVFILPILGHARLGMAAFGACYLAVAIVAHRRLRRLTLPSVYVWRQTLGAYLPCLGIGVAVALW